MSELNKAAVRRWVDEAIDEGRLDVLAEIYAPDLVEGAKRWIAPFRESFPDVHMDILDLLAEGDKVVGRFTCSGTHLGEWRGHPPSGRRFERIAEVYIFKLRDGRIVDAWGIEDTLARLEQLGIL